MLDLSAKPTNLPPAGPAPEVSDLPQTPLESASETDAEGFSGLLANSMQSTVESQDVMTGLGELAGLLADRDLPASGTLLPHDVAAGALGLPQALAPVAHTLAQASVPAAAGLSDLPPKQALASAVQSLLPAKTGADSERWHPVVAGNAERAGLAESGVVQERLLEVVRGLEPMSLMRSSATGSEPSIAFSAPLGLGGVATTSSVGDQAMVKLPPVNAAVGEKGWDQAIGERITWMLGNRVQQAEVRLSPPHLGPLEIKVAVHNDQASVSIAAAHVVTREAIESAIPRLREMMLEGNLNLVNVDVHDRNPGQQNTSGQSSSNGDGTAERHADSMDDLELSDHERGRTRTVATTLLDDYA